MTSSFITMNTHAVDHFPTKSQVHLMSPKDALFHSVSVMVCKNYSQTVSGHSWPFREHQTIFIGPVWGGGDAAARHTHSRDRLAHCWIGLFRAFVHIKKNIWIQLCSVGVICMYSVAGKTKEKTHQHTEEIRSALLWSGLDRTETK